MRRIKIIGTGRYAPEKVLTNDDLSALVDTSDEWITERTGIKERRIAADDQATSDLAAEAIKSACRNADMDPKDLDGIIVGTCSPDTLFPSVACWLQPKLGVSGIPAFDVMAGCSGFMYAMDIATNWLGSGRGKRLAVCGAEIFSRIVNWSDRRTCVLFGDAAGAVIVEAGKDDSSGILASNWGSDGNLASILKIPAGGSAMPPSHATIDDRLHTVYMEGSKVFAHAVRAMAGGLGEAMKEAGLGPDDIDVLIPHQANMRIMEATRERTKIPKEKVFSILHRYGNVSAASIPVALSEAVDAGVLKRGDLLGLTAFGTGLTWASSVMRW